MIKHLTLSTLLFCSSAFALRSVPTDAEAQVAHANGSCGSLGPGTGLNAEEKGWIVSMLPGKTEFRLDGGTVYLSGAKIKNVMDFDAGRPYYIQLDNPKKAKLEWRIPGTDWGPVSKLFLYPPQGNIYKPQ